MLERSLMRRSTLFVLLGLAAAGCAESGSADLGPDVNYDLSVVQTGGITVAQDDTLRVTGTVVRDGNVAIQSPLILWTIDDLSIASIAPSGGTVLVTGKKGGSTILHGTFSGKTVDVPVTVTPRPATSVTLTFNHTGQDSATAFAVPALAAGAWLKAVVRVGNDTVYCNPIACGATVPPRKQRIVQFTSLEPTEATISNTAATAGQITALDTTGNRFIGFVLSVPADGIADTAWINFSLRPIDSITVRPGTYTVPAANNGLTTLTYSSSFPRDSSILLVVDQQGRRDSTTTLAGRTQANVTITRPVPVITWESANDAYAIVDATGRVQGLRNTWATADIPAGPNNNPPGVACSNTPVRVTATDVVYNYDRVATRFPIPETVSSPTTANPLNRVVPSWVVPTGCVAGTGPATVARGVHCTHPQPTGTNPIPTTASCTVLIRAKITDPTGSPLDGNNDGIPDNVKTVLFPVVVRT
jgi:hypothetical protein